jgi:hypothetical protein
MAMKMVIPTRVMWPSATASNPIQDAKQEARLLMQPGFFIFYDVTIKSPIEPHIAQENSPRAEDD